MPYQFAIQNRDYSDYASGHVFYGTPGHPAFPVRLISEIFQRCWAIRQAMGLTTPVVLYDPCCGSAYHLSTLAYLHWHEIDTLIGSDIDANILSVAERNLSLLTQSGIERRVGEIEAMQMQYGKTSHDAAAQSAQQLGNQLQKHLADHPVHTLLFTADATNDEALRLAVRDRKIDLVIADVPYGRQSNWQSTHKEVHPNESLLWQMLESLSTIVTNNTVVAIITDKAQKCEHGQYERVSRFQIGKRRITLLRTFLAPADRSAV